MSDVSLGEVLSSFSARAAGCFTGEHGVFGGLGAWMLAALLAPAVDDADGEDLDAALGCDRSMASLFLAEILASPHDAVRDALAVWFDDSRVDDEAAGVFVSTLPPECETGELPTAAWADAWAAKSTGGVISSFPAHLGERSAVVAASALAARTRWVAPLTRVRPARLGGQFEAHVEYAMVSRADDVQFIAHHPEAGLVAVHVAAGADGLSLASVIADPLVPRDKVHTAALEVVAYLSGRPNAITPVSLFLLPLGSGAAWDITELTTLNGDGGEMEDVTCVLAPWSLLSDHDLLRDPAVAAAASGLMNLVGASAEAEIVACQRVSAEFNDIGLSAAAVSAAEIVVSGSQPGAVPALLRRATVRFNRPHAAVVFTAGGDHLWAGTPVFSVWVGRAG